jgi:hypothetical protein
MAYDPVYNGDELSKIVLSEVRGVTRRGGGTKAESIWSVPEGIKLNVPIEPIDRG